MFDYFEMPTAYSVFENKKVNILMVCGYPGNIDNQATWYDENNTAHNIVSTKAGYSSSGYCLGYYWQPNVYVTKTMCGPSEQGYFSENYGCRLMITNCESDIYWFNTYQTPSYTCNRDWQHCMIFVGWPSTMSSYLKYNGNSLAIAKDPAIVAGLSTSYSWGYVFLHNIKSGDVIEAGNVGYYYGCLLYFFNY